MSGLKIIGALATAALVIVSACGDDETSATTSTTSSTTSTNTTSASGGSGGMTSTGGNGGSGGSGGACTEFAQSCTMGTTTCCDYAGETGVCHSFNMGDRCTIPCPADESMCPGANKVCTNMMPSVCNTGMGMGSGGSGGN
jgi:hypothetical protein